MGIMGSCTARTWSKGAVAEVGIGFYSGMGSQLQHRQGWERGRGGARVGERGEGGEGGQAVDAAASEETDEEGLHLGGVGEGDSQMQSCLISNRFQGT